MQIISTSRKEVSHDKRPADGHSLLLHHGVRGALILLDKITNGADCVLKNKQTKKVEFRDISDQYVNNNAFVRKL